jgi:pimeloyl-ACP methyl ester carboxylesterase
MIILPIPRGRKARAANLIGALRDTWGPHEIYFAGWSWGCPPSMRRSETEPQK